MAKDDYQVIVYQILAYLYNCLKKGLPIDTSYVEAQGKLFEINDVYWRFIMFNLVSDGFVDGITLNKAWGEKYPNISGLENIGITPKGIQYLTENSLMEKAKRLLKDTKSIIPFV